MPFVRLFSLRSTNLIVSRSLSEREQYGCVITKAFEGTCAEKLKEEGRVKEAPGGVGQHPMISPAFRSLPAQQVSHQQPTDCA